MEKAQHLDDQFLSMPQAIGFDAANFRMKEDKLQNHTCIIMHSLSFELSNVQFGTTVRIGS